VGLPPQPERFVGRVGVIARASTALAVTGSIRGVVLHGMAGAGKTTCAAELVHTHLDRFDAVAWFKAPDEGADTSDALSRFALVLEARVPGLEFVHLLDDADALRRFLPTLIALTARNRVLIVIDGAESLLTHEGAWQDERWALVLDALTTVQGLWRAVITSRRPVAGLDGCLAREAVHALDLDEAVLLARDLPHLRALLDGHVPSLGATAAKQLAGRVLVVAQGHPTLLELANGQAQNTGRLRMLLADADHAWIAHGGLPQGFFATGLPTASAADYTDLLTTWTRSAAQGLARDARAMFWFLCCLQEADRSGPHLDGIIEATWAEVWEHTGLPGRAPATRDLVGAVAQRALAATDRDPVDGHLTGCRVHPLVAAAAREQAGMNFQTAVDSALAGWWTQTMLAAMHGEGGESTGTVVLAGRFALSYLMRLGQWQAARLVLDEALVRDRSRSAVGAALPLARRLVRATVGTEEHLWTRWSLAQLTGWLNPADGLAAAREVMAEAAKAGRYDVASIAAWNVIDACRLMGRLAEALEVASTMADYSRRAGFGPLTELLDKSARLRVLLVQGEYGQVLAVIDELLARVEGLADTSELPETTSRWNVLETLSDIGLTAAIERHLWEQALTYGERIAASQLQRDAPTHEAARAWFNTSSALLGLGRTAEAIEVLRACREVYEADGEVRMLSKVLTALATAEDERGHGPAALALVRDALRLAYRTDNLDDIAISHHNLGNYLARYGTDPAEAAVHYLGAALISALTGSHARLDTCLESLALLDLPDPHALPANPAALAQAVNQIDGVRIDRLLDSIAPDPAQQQRALDHVLDRRRQGRRQMPG
jgi:tetratricopeptide (TPR) repeat protein